MRPRILGWLLPSHHPSPSGNTGNIGLAPPIAPPQRLPHFCVCSSLRWQTPTRRSFTPAIPVGRSSWMPAAWRSTCASTRPRRSSCSRQSRTSTSPTATRAGRQSRSSPPGSSSSAPATAPSLPRPTRPRGRPHPPSDPNPAQPLFKTARIWCKKCISGRKEME